MEEYYKIRFYGMNSKFYFHCYKMIEYLQRKIGGTIFQKIKGNTRIYLLEVNNNFIDGSGVYTNVESVYKIHGDEELTHYREGIDYGTDYECCAFEVYVDEIINTMNM
jgi:hypothetical protein